MQWPALTVLAILMALIHTAALRGKAIQRGEAEIFPSSLVLRATYFLGSLFFLALELGFVYILGWRKTGWLSLIFLGFPIVVIASWPSTILVGNDGVVCIRPFRKTVVIPKKEILAVVFDSKQLTTSVCGVNASIVHGNYHAASTEFRRLLSQWCTVEEQ
jgi:hypothetical protein